MDNGSQVTTPCIEWTKCRNKQGYGIAWLDGKSVVAHRVAWITRFGYPPPETPYVLHRCDHPPCVNVDHLWLGTKGDNNRDAFAKGRNPGNGFDKRTHCKNGHEFTPENTLHRERGRRCRECHRAESLVGQRARRARNRERASA